MSASPRSLSILRAFSLILSLTASGCERSRQSAEGYAVRDSAGIRIVENMVPAWDSSSAWRLGDSPRIVIPGDGPVPEQVPFDPVSAFFNAAGELIIADGGYNGWHKLLVYDADGNFLRSLGRDGPGPCEFGQVWWARPYGSDSIAVFDYAQDVVSILESDGDCVGQMRLPQHQPAIPPGTYGFAGGADGVFEDGSVAVSLGGYLDIEPGPGPVWYRQAILRVDRRGQASDSLGVFPIQQTVWNGSAAQGYSPFGLVSHRAVHGHYLYQGTGELYQYEVHGERGRLTKLVRRSFTRAPVTPANQTEYVEVMAERASSHGGERSRQSVQASLENETEWLDLKPAFTALLVDEEGNVWVENYRGFLSTDVPPNPPSTFWSVFDPEGRWLGEVEVPGRLLIRTVGPDHVIGLWKLDSGVSEVRVYPLRRGDAA